MNRRAFNSTLPLLLTPSLSRARTTSPVEGTHYSLLREPQAPAVAGKIEVLEFFSYACPACSAFEPSLERWARTLTSDVSFRRVPVPFLNNAENFQRTFFALEMTGTSSQIHSKVFEAVHVGKQRLAKPEEIAALVARVGGDQAKFMAAFSSFSMDAHLARAKAATSRYRIDQIPTLAIAGRFTTSPGQAGGAIQALAVTDLLIQRSRKSQP